jgi:hypothetical protein
VIRIPEGNIPQLEEIIMSDCAIKTNDEEAFHWNFKKRVL